MFRLRVFIAIHDQYVFLPSGISFGDEMYFTFTLDIGRPLLFSGLSETTLVLSETIAAYSLSLLPCHTSRHLLSGVQLRLRRCTVWAEAAMLPGPQVDLTMTSRAKKPSKNSNAANHHMVGSSNTRCSAIELFFASRYLRICGLLYDTTMMASA